MKKPDIERIKHLVQYDPESGLFTWLNPTSARARKGSTAGCLNQDGYIVIRLDGVLYRAHRLAVYLETGAWPDGDIDHRDGVRTNNAASNLRHVSRTVNMQNLRRARRDNSTGVLGVAKCGTGYRSAIKHNGKQIHLGCFSTAADAHQAYLSAKRALHEGCTI